MTLADRVQARLTDEVLMRIGMSQIEACHHDDGAEAVSYDPTALRTVIMAAIAPVIADVEHELIAGAAARARERARSMVASDVQLKYRYQP